MLSVKIIKKQSKKTFINQKTKKENHYYNYFMQLENGKRICICCKFKEDYRALDLFSEFEK